MQAHEHILNALATASEQILYMFTCIWNGVIYLMNLCSSKMLETFIIYIYSRKGISSTEVLKTLKYNRRKWKTEKAI